MQLSACQSATRARTSASKSLAHQTARHSCQPASQPHGPARQPASPWHTKQQDTAVSLPVSPHVSQQVPGTPNSKTQLSACQSATRPRTSANKSLAHQTARHSCRPASQPRGPARQPTSPWHTKQQDTAVGLPVSHAAPHVSQQVPGTPNSKTQLSACQSATRACTSASKSLAHQTARHSCRPASQPHGPARQPESPWHTKQQDTAVGMPVSHVAPHVSQPVPGTPNSKTQLSVCQSATRARTSASKSLAHQTARHSCQPASQPHGPARQPASPWHTKQQDTAVSLPVSHAAPHVSQQVHGTPNSKTQLSACQSATRPRTSAGKSMAHQTARHSCRHASQPRGPARQPASPWHTKQQDTAVSLPVSPHVSQQVPGTPNSKTQLSACQSATRPRTSASKSLAHQTARHSCQPASQPRGPARQPASPWHTKQQDTAVGMPVSHVAPHVSQQVHGTPNSKTQLSACQSATRARTSASKSLAHQTARHSCQPASQPHGPARQPTSPWHTKQQDTAVGMPVSHAAPHVSQQVPGTPNSKTELSACQSARTSASKSLAHQTARHSCQPASQPRGPARQPASPWHTKQQDTAVSLPVSPHVSQQVPGTPNSKTQLSACQSATWPRTSASKSLAHQTARHSCQPASQPRGPARQPAIPWHTKQQDTAVSLPVSHAAPHVSQQVPGTPNSKTQLSACQSATRARTSASKSLAHKQQDTAVSLPVSHAAPHVSQQFPGTPNSKTQLSACQSATWPRTSASKSLAHQTARHSCRHASQPRGPARQPASPWHTKQQDTAVGMPVSHTGLHVSQPVPGTPNSKTQLSACQSATRPRTSASKSLAHQTARHSYHLTCSYSHFFI